MCGKKISHATLAKAEKVYDAAQREPTTFGQIWRHLNSEKISPDKAYKDMQGIQTRHSETLEPQPPTTKGADKGKEVITQISRRHVTACEHCQSKDSRIKELEEVVRKRPQLTSVNQIAEGGDDNIKQLQNELDERTRELSDKTSQIDKLSADLKRIKEKQAEVHKDENLNLANVDVSKTGDFEFSLLLGDIKYRLAALYPHIGDAGKVWFSGKLDKESGRILSIRFGRLGDNI